MRGGARALLAVFAGLLMVQAHIGFAPLALVSLAPLILAVLIPDAEGDPIGLRDATMLGALAYAVVGLHMYSVGEASFRTYASAVLYGAIGGAIFGASIVPLARLRPSLRVVGVAGAWVLADATRIVSSISFPTLLGPTLVEVPELAQAGAVGGPWALDLLVGLVSALLAESSLAFACSRERARVLVPLGAAVVLVIGVAGAGAARLAIADGEVYVVPDGSKAPSLTVAVPQGSIPAWTHRRAWTWHRLQQAIDAHYSALIAATGPADLVAIPESAFGKTFAAPPNDAGQLAALLPARAPASTTFLAAITRLLPDVDATSDTENREDVAVALSRDGDGYVPGASAAKRRLVPYLERRFRPGQTWEPLATQAGPVGTLICWESLYPGGGVVLAERGAQVLVVLTNDSVQRWGTGTEYHARLTTLRALESGLPMIYASQSGPTFAADPYGRKTTALQPFEVGALTFGVSAPPVFTPYGIIGEHFLWLPALLYLWPLGVRSRRWRTSKAG